MSVHIEMINLARAEDRRIHMRPEMALAEFTAEFHPAFDYKNEDPETMQALCRPEGPWGVFHPSNMACTISHKLVWERFLQTDATHCLVLEDDVFISPDLGDWIADMSWWPVDADLVKIERWLARSLKVLMEPHSNHKGRRINRMLSRHAGSAGYFLTRDAARKLCDDAPYDLTIDQLMFNFNASPVARAMKVYQIDPALVEQGNEPDNTELYMGRRQRPTGMALVRQKLKRLYYELAYPFSTLVKFVTGRAKLDKVTFARTIPEKSTNGATA